MAGIRIDVLPSTALPSKDHVFPAMKDGLPVKLSIEQVAAVMLSLGLIDDDTAQNLLNKTLTQPVLILKQGLNPTPTAEGEIQWDTDDDELAVGSGAGTKRFADKSRVLLLSGGTLAGGLLIGGSTPGGNPGPDKANAIEWQQGGVAIRPRILSASVATTSGTGFDFLSIPSWAKEIRIGLVGVSLSGTDDLLIQIGSGSVDTTGYSAACVNTLSPNALATATSTAGFNLVGGDAAGLFNGTVILTLVDAATNTWNVMSSASPTSVRVVIGAGTKSVAGVIDRARLTRSGSNTFDAGKASITVMG